ncbi:hypothetical protein SOASR030_15140 [Leminorella grimontii]|uniref:Uncharacterized protein n=1 Tax=Leminorella grimontii TaxID=82981 RepID=A0AAV5N0Y4_9GAMM|nr:hypothetical protein SOASR030_15140 [Leminorella grimontii]
MFIRIKIIIKGYKFHRKNKKIELIVHILDKKLLKIALRNVRFRHARPLHNKKKEPCPTAPSLLHQN